MNISTAKTQIINTIKAYQTKDEFGQPRIPQQRQRPIFLLGAPGLGKTAIVEEIASELGLPLVSYSMTHHTRQSAIGLPFIVDNEYNGKKYRSTEYTMSEIIAKVYEVMKLTNKDEGILFLDELNCVSETLAPAMLQFLQYKVFGQHKVPSGWIIITAGNPPEFNDQVRSFDLVTWDRLKKIAIDPDVDSWLRYANENNVHPAVSSFISVYKDNLLKVEKAPDGMHVVTPRSWVDLSSMIKVYEENGFPVDENLINQYLQDAEIATSFAAYYDLFLKYRSDYGIDDIFAKKYSRDLVKRASDAKFDERISLLGLITERAIDITTTVSESEAVNKQFLNALQSTKQRLATRSENGSAIQEVMMSIANDMRKSLKSKLDANMISKSEERVMRTTIAKIEKNAARFGMDLRDAGFAEMIKVYKDDIAAIKKSSKSVKEQLNNAFCFIEESLSDQEMLIFTTSLTQNTSSSAFIKNWGCEKYFAHNKDLQVFVRQSELEEDIANLEKLISA